jgi:hypothetical protein
VQLPVGKPPGEPPRLPSRLGRLPVKTSRFSDIEVGVLTASLFLFLPEHMRSEKARCFDAEMRCVQSSRQVEWVVSPDGGRGTLVVYFRLLLLPSLRFRQTIFVLLLFRVGRHRSASTKSKM